MKHLVFTLVLMMVVPTASTASTVQTETPAAKRPNIILIVADDLGFGDIAVNGATRIKTLNLDSLAQSGLMMTSFYSNACTPSRAGILTGRFAIRAGVGWKVLGLNDERGLSADEITISSLMKQAGYKTAMVGK